MMCCNRPPKTTLIMMARSFKTCGLGPCPCFRVLPTELSQHAAKTLGRACQRQKRNMYRIRDYDLRHRTEAFVRKLASVLSPYHSCLSAGTPLVWSRYVQSSFPCHSYSAPKPKPPSSDMQLMSRPKPSGLAQQATTVLLAVCMSPNLRRLDLAYAGSNWGS